MTEPKHDLHDVAIITRSKDDGTYCGDLCKVWHKGDHSILVIIDGLGHGELAQEASMKACEYLENNLSLDLPDLYKGCDHYISATRGVAMGIVKINHVIHQLEYMGVGNTQAILCSKSKYIRLISQWGIVGAGIDNLIHEIYPIFETDHVILFTDGIDTHFNPQDYDDKWQCTRLTELANDIVSGWATNQDDIGVLLYREQRAI